MPDPIVILRVALMVGLAVATFALLAWLLRPKVRRRLEDAALIPWRDQEPRLPRPEDRR